MDVKARHIVEYSCRCYNYETGRLALVRIPAKEQSGAIKVYEQGSTIMDSWIKEFN
jgi:hypothetical protein